MLSPIPFHNYNMYHISKHVSPACLITLVIITVLTRFNLFQHLIVVYDADMVPGTPSAKPSRDHKKNESL